MKWYIFVVGAVTIIRPAVNIALDMTLHCGNIKFTGILSLLLVAFAVVLEVTHHYISNFKLHRLLTGATGLWVVYSRRRVAPESNPPIPGNPFNPNGLGIRTYDWDLTAAALAISIAAFAFSSLQALVAYLQLNDSEVWPQLCPEEVMGKLWASKVTRKYNWREWRYQVFFEVPVFFTAPPGYAPRKPFKC
jgi:hypothetical protein